MSHSKCVAMGLILMCSQFFFNKQLLYIKARVVCHVRGLGPSRMSKQNVLSLILLISFAELTNQKRSICRNHILYPLRLRPPFSNDVGILKPKVGLGPNHIETGLRENICLWFSLDVHEWLNCFSYWMNMDSASLVIYFYNQTVYVNARIKVFHLLVENL